MAGFTPPAPDTIVRHDTIVVIVRTDTVILVTDTLEGEDSEGRNAEFYIVLTKECYWDYWSNSVVLLNGNQTDLPTSLFKTAAFQRRLAAMSDIIAVGAASEEGPPDRNFDLATERANLLMHWLRGSPGSESAKFWYMVLGQHAKGYAPTEKESAVQRSIIVIGITRKEAGVDLEAALRDALERNNKLPFELQHYPPWRLTEAS